MIKLDLFTHQPLQALNTLAVPAVAGNYVRVQTVAQVKQALDLAKELDLPILVLGGGSNVVLPDLFVGLVIHIAIAGIEVVNESTEHVWLKIGAGENWHSLVEHCLNFHYWGIENLALIPGTVGAAPIQNIGAYGVELESVFEELKAVEIASQVEVTFNRDSCEFAYRDSIFKNRFQGAYIITSVTLRLHKKPSVRLEYPALRSAIDSLQLSPEQITPILVAEAVCQIRRSKLPDPEALPNAGSFFKNPIVGREMIERLKTKFPDLVSYPQNEAEEKVAAAWLIDKAGWKGVEEFGVGVHKDQALVLVNPGKKSGRQVLELAEKIRADIEQKFGIRLQIEPACFA
jgi:UDP-N-acetylmuramate dehydrogenase